MEEEASEGAVPTVQIDVVPQPGHPGPLALVQVEDTVLGGHGAPGVQKRVVSAQQAVTTQVDTSVHIAIPSTGEEKDVQAAGWGGEDSCCRIVGRSLVSQHMVELDELIFVYVHVVVVR